jgi:hypothetical protein
MLILTLSREDAEVLRKSKIRKVINNAVKTVFYVSFAKVYDQAKRPAHDTQIG